MADRTFPLPDLGEGLIDATVLEWYVAVGDRIDRDAPIVELETTKSALEIPSPVSGVVSALHGAEGSVIQVGDPLITFTVADDEAGIVGMIPDDKEPTRRIRLQKPDS